MTEIPMFRCDNCSVESSKSRCWCHLRGVLDVRAKRQLKDVEGHYVYPCTLAVDFCSAVCALAWLRRHVEE